MGVPCSRPPAQHCELKVRAHLTFPLIPVNMVQPIAAVSHPQHRSIPPNTDQGWWGSWRGEELGARIHEEVGGSGVNGRNGEQLGGRWTTDAGAGNHLVEMQLGWPRPPTHWDTSAENPNCISYRSMGPISLPGLTLPARISLHLPLAPSLAPFIPTHLLAGHPVPLLLTMATSANVLQSLPDTCPGFLLFPKLKTTQWLNKGQRIKFKPQESRQEPLPGP